MRTIGTATARARRQTSADRIPSSIDDSADGYIKTRKTKQQHTHNALFYVLLVGMFLVLAAKKGANMISHESSLEGPSPRLQRRAQEASLLDRAEAHYRYCRSIGQDRFDKRTYIPYRNHSLPALPAFGVLDDDFSSSMKVCTIPKPEACDQTQLTVIFMAYNPDRLGKTFNEMKKLITYEFVAEIILVWNGERDIGESKLAGQVAEIARIVFPIRDHNLPNDLMNRYHPKVLGSLKTDCLLYYDDDGPFYSKHAIESAFELWKRNAQHQIGAMARHIHTTAQPTKPIIPDDTKFTPHCANDTVDYEFRFFANYDAQMVLPSGSLLHRNYLCFIWHDAMKTVRKFVLEHPVHPDDMTVSMLVSQLAGVAPKVYSRRLKAKATSTTKRRMMETSDQSEDTELYEEYAYHQHKRRLAAAGMGGVCWDCGSGMTEQKEIWAYLRTEAISSLVRYFGSLSTGSIGWCPMDSPFYSYKRDGRCNPDMAEIGSLSWMNADGSPKTTCP